MSEKDTRGGPKPKPKGSIIKNPSTPGVQKPGNKPDGRDAPPPEKRD